MPDEHYRVGYRMRLCMDVCPAGAVCQHRRGDGSICGEALDSKGWHARQCGVGFARTARHDSLRDWHGRRHRDLTGHAVATEQRVPAWDRVDPISGALEEARLDLATRDAVAGSPVFIDWSITCEYSSYAPRRFARSNKDGLAATQQVAVKRARYPPAGGDLIPLVFESGGRPSDEAVAFVRCYGHGLDDAERSAVVGDVWRQLSRVLRVGTADMVLSAL